MFQEGTTFWIHQDRHLWVIISAPSQSEEEVVHVNFTTLDTMAGPHDPSNDRACVVGPGEHRFIEHPSCIYYYGVQIASIPHLRIRYQRHEIRFDEPVTPALLAKIRHGASVSEHILPIAYDILLAQGLI